MAKQSDTELSFRDYLQVFKRRAPVFLVVAGAILLIGVAIAYRVPPSYQSSGVLLAAQPDGTERVVQSSVPNYPEERVRVVTQRVLTTENLERIIEENDLYPELSSSQALAELRGNIELSAEDPQILQNILGASRSEGTVAFSIAFTHSSPRRARDVANALVSLYLEENQRARQQQAEETTQFLTEQAKRLEKEIAEREERIAEFKEEHADSLPGREQTNLELLDRTERDLEEVEQEIRSLRERRSLYSSELAQLSPHEAVVNEEGNTVLGPQDRLELLQREYMRLSGVYSAQHPDVKRVRRELTALSESTGLPAFDREVLQSELNARQEELASARDQYSSSHPNVQRLESRVATLRERLEDAPPASGSDGTSTSTPPDNPVYIQKQVQLEATRTELQAALDRREELRARVSELESRLSASPQVERRFNELQRGHEQLLTQYEEVETKLREAQMAQTLESESTGDRFTMLSSPVVPGSPSQPNRVAVLLLTLAISVALGSGSVAAVESFDSSVRNARDVAVHLDIPPLVAIPQVNSRADAQRIRMRRLFATAAIGVWAGAVALLVMTPAA